MKIRLGRPTRPLLFVGPLAALFAAGAYACLPEPDTTGLPPRDAGTFDASVTPPADASHDGSPETDAAPPTDAGGTGTIDGIVLDYFEFGRGVVPGATVSVQGGPSTTTDAFGRFALTGVPAGSRVLVTVTKPTAKTTDETNRYYNVAWGTAQAVVALAPGATVSVFPTLAEGCVVRVPLSTVTQDTVINLQRGCDVRGGAYASITLPSNGVAKGASIFSGTARIELVPLVYAPDLPGGPLSASLTLPGDLAGKPAGGALTRFEPLGATEVRLVDDATDEPLRIADGKSAVIELPAYRAPADAEPATAWAYDSALGTWVEDTSAGAPNDAGPPDFLTESPGSATVDTFAFRTARLGWWAVGHPRVTTGCIKGKIVSAGQPAAGVVLQGTGDSYLGSSRAVTDAAGAFCLEGNAGGTLRVIGGLAQAVGSPSVVLTTAFTASAAGAGCANAAACKDVGTIPLTSIAPACVQARVTGQGTTPVTTALEVNLVVPNPTSTQAAVGLHGPAYVGVVTPGDAGQLCAPAAGGTQLQLFDRTGTVCPGDFLANATLQVPPSPPVAACGSAGCADGGVAAFNCPVPQ